MRLCLTLTPCKPFSIPFNYQHYLAGVVYDGIEKSSREHSKWLHDCGYWFGAKSFKHFTFSKLIFDKKPDRHRLGLIVNQNVQWYISLALPESLQHFVTGIFEKQQFWIEQKDQIFRVLTVETLPDPVFSETMKFKMLSPLFLKKPYLKENQGVAKLSADHLMPDHPKFSQILRKNLVEKYLSLEENRTLSSSKCPEIENAPFEFIPDWDYIKRRGGISKISKLITFYEGQPQETKNRAFECPFTLTTHPALMKTAYDSGLGCDNSMGFGMIETLNI